MEKELIRIKYADSTITESFVFDGGKQEKEIPIIFSVFLIKTQNRRILVDAGCETMPGFKMENFVSPVQVLEEHGIYIGDITDVIITHAHHDHIEAVHYFEKAVVHIEKEVYEKGCRYIPKHFNVNIFENEYCLSDDIKIVKIGGHSRGSCVVELLLDGKEYVLCGDECYLYYNLKNHVPTAKTYSLEKSQYFIEKYSNSRYTCLLCHEA